MTPSRSSYHPYHIAASKSFRLRVSVTLGRAIGCVEGFVASESACPLNNCSLTGRMAPLIDWLALPIYHKRKETEMLVKITSKRQVTFPKRVLDEMGVGPGDRLELLESPDGYILRPKRIDRSKLGTLRDKIKHGTPPFDIRKFRDEGYDPYKYRD